MGGRVGLKGSDGSETLKRAKELGAKETSPARASEALKQIVSIKDQIELFTYPKEMGEDEARSVGLEPKVIGAISVNETTSADTRAAATEMAKLGVDLLLFAGGDGTARDICEAINSKVTALGIPSGVKIHSAVYAVSPAAAGTLANKYLRGEVTSVQQSEVMDIDEEAFRENRLSARLYGYLRVPVEESTCRGRRRLAPSKRRRELKAQLRTSRKRWTKKPSTSRPRISNKRRSRAPWPRQDAPRRRRRKGEEDHRGRRERETAP
jgi:predicted polyphosphate/ATP-dependent NAD kinase